MKGILKKYSVTPGFLVFILMFSYLDSIKNRIQSGQQIDAYLFTPEAIISIVPTMLLIVFLIGTMFLQSNPSDTRMLSVQRIVSLFLLSLGVFILAANFLSISISLIFDTVSRNFSRNQILSANLGYMVDFFIYGGFYLAFFLFQKEKSNQRQLSQYNVALAASQIRQLRQQLDPHFLFNNLNILDQLIHQNAEKASAFLLDFSDLYRYLLENANKELVSVQSELSFAQKYFELIRYKFGQSYELQVDLPDSLKGEIPALSLQVLFENAVEHNLGTASKPILIEVFYQNGIVVRNNLVAKVYKKKTGGRALQNLQTQLKVIGNQDLEIRKSEVFFEVVLPVSTREDEKSRTHRR